MEVRERNYDLLRIVSTLAVIVIHVTSFHIKCVLTGEMQIDFGKSKYLNLLNMLMRFVVLCFIILSGAFVLEKKRNSNYKYGDSNSCF